jgi:hypothetical protein
MIKFTCKNCSNVFDANESLPSIQCPFCGKTYTKNVQPQYTDFNTVQQNSRLQEVKEGCASRRKSSGVAWLVIGIIQGIMGFYYMYKIAYLSNLASSVDNLLGTSLKSDYIHEEYYIYFVLLVILAIINIVTGIKRINKSSSFKYKTGYDLYEFNNMDNTFNIILRTVLFGGIIGLIAMIFDFMDRNYFEENRSVLLSDNPENRKVF